MASDDCEQELGDDFSDDGLDLEGAGSFEKGAGSPEKIQPKTPSAEETQGGRGGGRGRGGRGSGRGGAPKQIDGPTKWCEGCKKRHPLHEFAVGPQYCPKCKQAMQNLTNVARAQNRA